MRFPKTARRTDFPPWRAAKRKTSAVETKTVILCDEPDAVKAILNGELEKIDRELQDGKQNLTLEIRDTAANEMLSDADTQAIVDLIYLMPSNTVAIRTAGEEMTATNNVGTVSLNGSAFELVMSDRAAKPQL